MRVRYLSLSILPILILATWLAAGCIAPVAPQGATVPVPEPGKVTVVDPMARPSPMMAGNGAAYMTILNGTDQPVQLLAARSDAAETVELHETVNDGGMMRMVYQPEGFAIPAGGSVELKPGGKHVMLINLVEPLEIGSEVQITLEFDSGEPMTITVPVVEMKGDTGM